MFSVVLIIVVRIDLFTDTAAILNLLDLRSTMGCPGGALLTIYARFSGKKRTSLYISRERKNWKEKLAWKARVNIEQ